MASTLESWREICAFWKNEGGIGRHFSYLIINNCRSFINNSLTVRELFNLIGPLKGIAHEIYEDEYELVEKNEDIFEDWILSFTGIQTSDFIDSPASFTFKRDNARLILDICEDGFASVLFKDARDDEWLPLEDNIDKFYSIIYRTNI